MIEIDGAETISVAASADEEPVPDQNDDQEGHVIGQIADDEAVDDGSPENFHHAVFLALLFESYTGRICICLAC